MNRNVIENDLALKEYFLQLVKLRVHAKDPRLIAIARQLMDPPSEGILKTASPLRQMWTEQEKEAWKYLNQKVMCQY